MQCNAAGEATDTSVAGSPGWVQDACGNAWKWGVPQMKGRTSCTENPFEVVRVMVGDGEVCFRKMPSLRDNLVGYFNGWRLLTIKTKQRVLCTETFVPHWTLSRYLHGWRWHTMRTKHTKLLHLMAVWQSWLLARVVSVPLVVKAPPSMFKAPPCHVAGTVLPVKAPPWWMLGHPSMLKAPPPSLVDASAICAPPRGKGDSIAV